jgi:hypothetical protein
MGDTVYRGSCLCGGIRLSLATEALAVALCHCRHCQKQSGSAFSAAMIVPAAAIEIEGPLSEFMDVSDSGHAISRRFCGVCGSPVQTASAATDAQGITIIKAGLMDSPSMPAPQMQIYCERAVSWMPDLPGTARFERMPPPAEPSLKE